MVKRITSQSNTTIKQIRSLQDRKYRKQTGLFFIEGIRQVGEAIDSDYPLQLVIYCPSLLITDYATKILEKASYKGLELLEVSDDVFQSISNKDGPHGIAAVGYERFFKISDVNVEGLWIALENIQDPGNLGSILRSLDGAGGKGLFLVGESTDPFHPTAVRSSMGAVFYTPIIKLSLADFFEFVKLKDIFCVGTSCETTDSFKEQNYPKNMILIMGSEQKGMTDSMIDICDVLVNIPMSGRVDSLNIANAASIVLFEIHTRNMKND